MRIGYDAKRAVCNNTGLGNYSRLVIDTLSELYPDNEYLLYAPKYRENVRLMPILPRNNIHFELPKSGINRYFSSLWRVWGIEKDAKGDNIDIFHGLSNELPLNIHKWGVPSIVTIHDLIFLRYPEYYNPIDVRIYNYKFRKACENATRVIAISESTKRDIVNYYHISPEKIDIVYQGCDDNFKRNLSQEELNEVARKYSLPRRFILYVGTIEERKNLLLAVKSLANLPDDIHLVAVGRPTKYFDTVKSEAIKLGVDNRIHYFHNLPFAELPCFYSLAEVFVYPSRFEGFGIPMLEALSCGTPAIGATGSCLEEAGGAHSIYVNPDDEQELTNSIMSIINDSSRQKIMIEEGRKFAARFSRESISRNIMNIYEKILRH